MITKVSNNENAESGLLPYPVIIAATKGDPEAMAIVVKHYESYIASLSMRKFRDERGNTYWGIDEDIRDRLRSRLMRAVLSFESPFPLPAPPAEPFQHLDKESGAR